MSDLVLTIGDKNLSSWSLRPWLALRQADIPFREEMIRFDSPGQKEAFARRSPSALVPALHVGAMTVWDSLAICEYLAERFPDKALWPADAETRAMARAVTAEMHSGFGTVRATMPMNICGRMIGFVPARAAVPEIARIVQIWSFLRARHKAQGDFLFGTFTIADAFYAPVVTRFRTYGVRLEGDAAAYADMILGLAAFKAWEAGAAAEAAAAG